MMKEDQIMPWTKKRAVVAGVLVMAGVPVIAGAIGTSGARSASAERSPDPDVTVQEAIADLEQNLTALDAQQALERAEGVEAFALPPGASFGPLETFDGIESQLSVLEAAQLSESLSPAELEASVLYWYQDGFFTSLMAIDWRCAWLSTGVAQVEAGLVDDVPGTVELLHSFASTEHASSFPDYDLFLTRHVDPLLEGDTSGAYDYLPNCPASTLVN